MNCAPTTFGFYLFFLVTYFSIRICDAISWYPKGETPLGIDPKKVGIRVHFQKALVPTSYILFITSMVCLTTVGAHRDAPLQFVTVILANLCLLLVAAVNGILIWFHRRDKEELPINYFSLKKYLQGDQVVSLHPNRAAGTRPLDLFQPTRGEERH